MRAFFWFFVRRLLLRPKGLTTTLLLLERQRGYSLEKISSLEKSTLAREYPVPAPEVTGELKAISMSTFFFFTFFFLFPFFLKIFLKNPTILFPFFFDFCNGDSKSRLSGKCPGLGISVVVEFAVVDTSWMKEIQGSFWVWSFERVGAEV